MNTPFGSLCAPLPAIVLLFMTLLITGCAAREHSRSVEVQIPCGDNLLKNPSFEEGPFQGSRDDPAVMVIKNGSNAVAPWVVDNIVGDQGPRPNFFWVANGNQRGLVASERDHFLLFTRQTSETTGGYPVISQEVPLLTSGSFILTFDIGQQPPSPNANVSKLAVGVGSDCGLPTVRQFFIGPVASGATWQPQMVKFDLLPPLFPAPGCFIYIEFMAVDNPAPGAEESYVSLDNLSLKRLQSVGECVAAK